MSQLPPAHARPVAVDESTASRTYASGFQGSLPPAPAEEVSSRSLMYCVAACLAISWASAHGWYAPRAASNDPANHWIVPVLATGLIPWWLQWSAVSLAAICLNRYLPKLSNVTLRVIRMAIAALGLCWWCGMIIGFSSEGLVDSLTAESFRHLQRSSGREPLLDLVVLEVVGPILNPFSLSGPVTLARGFYWRSLASLAWLHALGLFVACLLNWQAWERGEKSRRTFAFAIAILLMVAPVILRALSRLAETVVHPG